MRVRAFVTAAALLAGMTGASFASCDIRAADAQALCALKCDDAYLRDVQRQTADIPAVKAAKKACDAKCGCPQNTQQ